jgi:hypothetical protein
MSLPGLALGGLLAFIAVSWLRSGYLSPQLSVAAVTISVIAGLIVLLVAATAGPARERRRHSQRSSYARTDFRLRTTGAEPHC